MPLWVDSPVLCEYLSSRSQAAGCQLGVAPVGLVIPSCTGGGGQGEWTRLPKAPIQVREKWSLCPPLLVLALVEGGSVGPWCGSQAQARAQDARPLPTPQPGAGVS